MVALVAHAVPSWVMAAREAAMQIHWQILKSTAFLGFQTERGFCASGTCFFLSVSDEELDFPYVVTCRHVVRPTISKVDQRPNPEQIWIRMNRKNGPPRVVETIRGDWIRHPHNSVDVCVYPFQTALWDIDGELDVSPLGHSIILTPERYEDVGLSLGDEVFIVGAFVGRVGERKNIPVVRIANVAALADEPVWPGSSSRPAFLIETRSLGGISGSPVFLHTSPGRVAGNWGLKLNKKGDVEAPYHLFAMMQGSHGGSYADDFIADDDAEKVVPTADVDFNAGISIAIPIDQVMEVINRSDQKEARMKTIEAKRKDSGYRPSSAVSKRALPASGENPNHLEDFRRLVDVAMRKKPQGDQT